MQITPYIASCNLLFGAIESEIVAKHGQPNRRSTTRSNKIELIYPSNTFRLCGASGELVELTTDSEYFKIDGCQLPGDKRTEVAFVELGYVVAKLDQDAFLAHGFVVSPKFGIAFDPRYPCHLTAFAKSELAVWQAFIKT